MNRACFTLEILAGQEDRYDRLHAEIGMALEAAISDAGLSNYTLFRLGRKVIGYVEAEPNFEIGMDKLISSEPFEAWATQFEDVFAASKRNVAELTRYEEIWHVD